MGKAKMLDVEELAWDRISGSFVPKDVLVARKAAAEKPPSTDRFLKGPVPWEWIIRASRLPGKTLILGLCLWRLKGATRKPSVLLSNSELGPFGIDRAAKSRGLAALEKAGLISVVRQ